MNGQISIFGELVPTVKIDKPIRLIELFAGIGSQAKALENLGADFSHYKVVEFDKYAIQSYNAIHHTEFPTMDITKVGGQDLEITDTDKYCYIMTYSFPCQDLSLAGKQRGMVKGSGTRSGLLWEVERILDECKALRDSNNRYGLPQFLLMENVPQVVGAKNREDFEEWCEFLVSLGYTNHWELLNAKDYLIPQNRNRCFMLSCGLGKTVTTLTAINDLMYDDFEVMKVLVVCPLRVGNVWKQEVEHWEHLHNLRISVAIGTAAERLAALNAEAESFFADADILKQQMGRR